MRDCCHLDRQVSAGVSKALVPAAGAPAAAAAAAAAAPLPAAAADGGGGPKLVTPRSHGLALTTSPTKAWCRHRRGATRVHR